MTVEDETGSPVTWAVVQVIDTVTGQVVSELTTSSGVRKGARTARRTASANPLSDLHVPMKKASEKEAVLLVAGAGFEPTTFGL